VAAAKTAVLKYVKKMSEYGRISHDE